MGYGGGDGLGEGLIAVLLRGQSLGLGVGTNADKRSQRRPGDEAGRVVVPLTEMRDRRGRVHLATLTILEVTYH